MPFAHLHTHSHYSLLDGLSKIEGIVDSAKKDGQMAVAITDHGNLYGAIDFYKACKKAEIKPIIGVEAYIANRTRFDKEPNIDDKRYHLTLLAKNNTGYKNLIKLVTKSQLEGYYYKPRMDLDLLRENSEGLICLSGCFGSELSHAIRKNDMNEAERIAKMYQDIFGAENYFFEIMSHPGIEGLMAARGKIIELGKKLNIPLVATQDSHYLSPDYQEAHETLLAIQTNGDLNDENRFSMASDHFHFASTKEMEEKFADIPEAVENTSRIADMCNIELELGKWVFPDFKIKEGSTYDNELKEVVYAGIEKRGLTATKEVTDRIEYELKIIKDKGFSVYMLIVADLLKFAAEKNIYTNIRGSVAGSLVSYLTFITKVNPLEYKLPFERFLNPERPVAPDIDMDFADDRRDEVIDYARQKYGNDHVAQIGTFGTMMARGVVRDVARALGYPYAIGDTISKLIPMGSQGFPMTIKRALELEPELKKKYDEDADTKRIIDLGKRLEGCVRHISVHAAGVVIAPGPLADFVPTQFDPKGGKIITQYDMYAVEEAGLLKFDFLGIRNLAILADAVDRVKKIRGLDIDIEAIPLNNAKTFEMLARGETMGLFQLNGGGMTKYLMELKPSSIHDINAMVALYRPGPIETIPQYIERKHHPELITYLDSRMKEFLDFSYGVLVYQDDVLLTAIKLGGYSWLEADKLRKAMGKKIPAEMEAQKEKLIKGFVENGMTPKKAAQMWALIEPFAAYGFNKAHAASYGRVAYQTSYMKANFPAEYMTAVLTAESGDMDKVSEIIVECKRMGFVVLPPDVNESYSDFTVVKDTNNIRFGLRSIKNFGEEIGKAIIRERKENGQFGSYEDFLVRVQHKNLNKKSLEALIMSGAMDSFGHGRGKLLGNLEEALFYNRSLSDGPSAQTSLFGLLGESNKRPPFILKDIPDVTLGDKLGWEKELLGMYVSGHPLETHKGKFENHEHKIDKVLTYRDGAPVLVAGILDEVKAIITKKGGKMAFCKLTDFTGSIETVAFPDTYEQLKEILVPDKCVAIKGTVSHRNGTVSIILDRAKLLE
ncbi:MAG TPA: DNA polymerase III subunit alpha [Candidatus Paceibacterota bacterium]